MKNASESSSGDNEKSEEISSSPRSSEREVQRNRARKRRKKSLGSKTRKKSERKRSRGKSGKSKNVSKSRAENSIRSNPSFSFSSKRTVSVSEDDAEEIRAKLQEWKLAQSRKEATLEKEEQKKKEISAEEKRKRRENEDRRREGRRRQAENEKSLYEYQHTAVPKTQAKAAAESERIASHLPNCTNKAGERSFMASNEKLKESQEYVTENFVSSLLNQTKAVKNKAQNSLLENHRKYLRKKVNNPVLHGIHVPPPKIPSLENARQHWMSFMQQCQIPDSVPFVFSNTTPFFSQLQKPQDCGQMNGVIYNLKGAANKH